MARPRTEPAQVRRRRILDAARATLIRSGYGAFNLGYVADRAGVAKGTLYLHFRDKDDLLASVFVDMLEGLERRLDELAPPDGTLASLRRMVEAELDFVEETHYFLAPFSPGSGILHGPRAGSPARRGRFLAHLDILARRVKACVASGVLRPVDPDDAAFFIVCGLRMCMIRKFVRGEKGPLRARSDELMELLLRGLGSGQAAA
ncbi:MAG: TetR/AcrR family transcriptional regulator [Elusimicrobia bacterium]|nr:TetR/AcrR family transcriptional regulator [Elusimicrobiota bacterium]